MKIRSPDLRIRRRLKLGKKHGLPIAYHKSVDQKSWLRMREQFQEAFGEDS